MTRDFELRRRDVFAAGALAAGAAAMPAFTPALAQGAAADPRPRTYQFSLGGLTISTLSDGLRKGEGPWPIFGQDQEESDVHALLEENFLPTTEFVNGFTPVLVDTGSEKILFDTGMGQAGRENGMGMLPDRLTAIGLSPADIDVVVLTHLHPDHILGLMTDGAPTFPNARYVTGEAEYAFWSDAARAEGGTARVHGMVQKMVTPLADKMTFLKPGGTVASGIEAVQAFGHTPGHMAFHIESEGRRLMLTADCANHYVVSLQRPDWHVQYDMDKEAAAATRRQVFGMLAADKVPFIGYHMPFPALGYVRAEGQGFRFMPETYQAEL